MNPCRSVCRDFNQPVTTVAMEHLVATMALVHSIKQRPWITLLQQCHSIIVKTTATFVTPCRCSCRWVRPYL